MMLTTPPTTVLVVKHAWLWGSMHEPFSIEPPVWNNATVPGEIWALQVDPDGQAVPMGKSMVIVVKSVGSGGGFSPMVGSPPEMFGAVPLLCEFVPQPNVLRRPMLITINTMASQLMVLILFISSLLWIFFSLAMLANCEAENHGFFPIWFLVSHFHFLSLPI